MPEISYSTRSLSAQPFGCSTTVKLRSTDNYISLHGSLEEQVVPYTQRFMRTDKNPGFIFGVTKAYNRTTNSDVTSDITKVKDYSVHFDSNSVSDNDLIELDMYVNWEGIRNDYSNVTGTITNISTEFIEQLYRFTSNLDRTDFGNYTPPYSAVFDFVDTSHNSMRYTYHPRIFFNSYGYYSTDTRGGGSISSGGPIGKSSMALISYSVASPKTVGGFIGDPSFEAIKGGNENYTESPTPMYLTELKFFCKLKNNTYSDSIGEAIRLNFNIDGQSRAIATAPNYEYPDNTFHILGAFTSDDDLLLSFSGASDYSGLPPAYKYARQLDDGDEYYFIHRIPLGIVRINSGITVSGALISQDDGVEEIDEYMISLGGIIPVTWEA